MHGGTTEVDYHIGDDPTEPIVPIRDPFQVGVQVVLEWKPEIAGTIAGLYHEQVIVDWETGYRSTHLRENLIVEH